MKIAFQIGSFIYGAGYAIGQFITIMYDTKEEVRRAYEIMKEGSKTIYKMEATPYSSFGVNVFDVAVSVESLHHFPQFEESELFFNWMCEHFIDSIE